MKHTAWKIYVLMRREFLEELSYKFNFILEILTILTLSSIFYFISKIFTGGTTPVLASYHGDYFSFVLIGLAFTGYINTGLSAFTATIRNEQMLGTLEFIISTPTSISLILFSRLLWKFFYSTINASIFFIFGIIFLNASYTNVNYPAIPVIVVMSVIAFNGLGMISAGFILIFKRGDPINMLLGFAASLLGGVFFPIEILPSILQKISAFIPITYALRLMRNACIRGYSMRELMPDMLILFVLCVLFAVIGYLFFSYAVKRTRMDGTLSHY